MLSPLLVQRPGDLWPGSLHVITEFGENIPDESVWVQARQLGLVIITKDSDYGDAAMFPGPPPQVVRLLIGNSRTAAVEAYIRAHAAEIEEFSRSGQRYLAI